MEQITVERDGAANIRFKGELIATTSGVAELKRSNRNRPSFD